LKNNVKKLEIVSRIDIQCEAEFRNLEKYSYYRSNR